MAEPGSKGGERKLPQNLDAERGVLGSILLMNEAIDEVGESLRAEHFYNDAHQKIYAAIQKLYEAGVRGIGPDACQCLVEPHAYAIKGVVYI